MPRNAYMILGVDRAIDLNKIISTEAHQGINDSILAEGQGQFEGIGDEELKKALFKNPCL